jgi:RHH-type proline utilization regulon transcriptional repressor/proline dehydrogenase/delta 1-pyrroline-5-carboxylate dehydrogenase
MAEAELERRIQARGRELFQLVSGETPSLFRSDWWTGKVLEWAMHHEEFKVQLFRFVDVLPVLTSEEALWRHVEEYFGAEGGDIPAVLRWGSKHEGLLGGYLGKVLAGSLRHNIEAMAHLFILGATAREALTAIVALRQEGFAASVDILGEAVISEGEAADYQQRYLDLLDTLAAAAPGWTALTPGTGGLDWGSAPRINLAVKPSSLFSQANPMDFANSVEAICQRLLPLARKAREIGAFLYLDMEQHRYKAMILAVYRRLKESPELRDYPHLGLCLQAYLRETPGDLASLLAWARQGGIPIAIRLVKGAYWDYETVLAARNGWPCPVYTDKSQTDAAFEQLAATILANHDLCHLACASHNIRALAAVRETAAALKVPEECYEFQMLYGMAGPVRRALLRMGGRVRIYGPFGELLPGMGYLVRRLLENTANESFLRLSFVEGMEVEKLLADPATGAAPKVPTAPKGGLAGLAGAGPFRNEPAADFSRPEVRAAFPEALAAVAARAGATYPVLIDNREVAGVGELASLNPADPGQVIGRVALAGPGEIDRAVAAATAALEGWRRTPVAARAACLFRAAERLRRDHYQLAALQVLEVGKQWDQAHADVAEAIDFCEYYGRRMVEIEGRSRLAVLPGEDNLYQYRGKGVAAVIAPWNFPLAISCGMCAAALVAGNTVLYKPSGLSPVCGAHLTRIFLDSGLPPGVFNFVPCRGEETGAHLVTHPGIHLIAFTGSLATGLAICRQAAIPAPGQQHLKRVIAEMGGKNAIIVDEDSDLDEAVPGVLASAFGYQGQKCSACSRVIVLEPVYDRFCARLVAAARSLVVGPPSDPAHALGPVIDAAAREKILGYLELARREGEILYQSGVPEGGYYVPLAIVANLPPAHRLLREEIFGPLLAVQRAPSFTGALELANASDYGLTGGVFSRSPANLALAREHFAVGNLYLNRGITGALVQRQPFGGLKLSGIGAKAGGPDYLLQFVDAVAISENTLRRGFAPRESAQ